MKKKLFLLATFLLLIINFAFAVISITLNVTPAQVHTNCYIRFYNSTSSTPLGEYGPFDTDSSGLIGIDLGTDPYNYRFGLKKTGSPEAFADNKNFLYQANTFNLTNPSNTNVYFTLRTSYSISGNVKNKAGANLANIKVEIYDNNKEYITAVTTNAGGNYILNDIGAGNYLIKAKDDSNVYFNQWYNGAYGYSDLTTVNVVNTNITNINFSLFHSATINGRVTDNATAGNLKDIVVAAFIKSGAFSWVNQVTTNASGQYSLFVPAVSVNMMLRASSTNYQDTFYKQEFYNWRNAITQNLTAGQNKTNVNFSLPKTYTLSGTVTSSHTGANLSGVTVNIYDNSGNWVKNAVTNGSGQYSVSLINGNYYVQTQLNNYFSQYYQNAWGNGDRDLVAISSANKPNINFSLHRNATITGTVYNGAGPGSLNNVAVTAYLRSGAFTYVNKVTANGTYSLTVPAGVALMLKTTTANYEDVFYNNVASWGGSTTVNVSPGGTSSNINFNLYRTWYITGNVQSRTGTPLNNIRINLYNSSGVWQRSASSNASGLYRVTANNGSFYLQVVDSAGNQYFTQWYNQAYGYGDRDLATVSNANLTGVNFSLYRQATITGTVKDSLGNNLNNISVMAFEKNGLFTWVAQTTGNATYSLTVPATIKLMVRATTTNSNYGTVFYNGASAWQTATTVSVAAGGTSSNINLALPRYFLITGNVQNRTGTNLSNIRINVYDNTGTWLKSVTANSGAYSVSINNGTYYVQALDLTNTYFPQYYNNAWGNNDRTAVVVAGSNQGSKSFSLYRSATVQGTVRNGDTGTNLNNVAVTAFLRNGSFTYVNRVTANGTYSLRVPAGVALMLKTSTSNYDDVFYNQATTWTNSATVNLIAGGTSTNINFNLYRNWYITGNVQSRTGTPLNNIRINLYNTSGTWIRSASSNVSGQYRVTANTGAFYLQAVDSAGNLYFTQWYNQAYGYGDRDAVTVNNATLTGINFSMYRRGTITGTIRDESSNPLNGASVMLFEKNSSFTWVSQATSNVAGVYSVIVPAGVNLMLRATRTGYETTFYNQTLTWQNAATINLLAGGTSSNINVNLNRWWRLAGTITTADGGSASGTIVRLYKFRDFNTLVSTTFAQSNGYYEFRSTSNLGYAVMVSYEKTGYYQRIYPTADITATASAVIPAQASITVSIGLTDTTTLNVTLNYVITPLPPWYSNVEDSMKSGPNPANPDNGPVHIGFAVEESAKARVLIYTLGGELVFSESKDVPRGYHEFLWEGSDRYKDAVPNGVYLGYMEVKTSTKTYKKVLKIAILK